MNIIELTLLTLISIHWGFATGGLIAMKTDYSVPRFILICLLIRYFVMSYGY